MFTDKRESRKEYLFLTFRELREKQLECVANSCYIIIRKFMYYDSHSAWFCNTSYFKYTSHAIGLNNLNRFFITWNPWILSRQEVFSRCRHGDGTSVSFVVNVIALFTAAFNRQDAHLIMQYSDRFLWSWTREGSQILAGSLGDRIPCFFTVGIQANIMITLLEPVLSTFLELQVKTGP